MKDGSSMKLLRMKYRIMNRNSTNPDNKMKMVVRIKLKVRESIIKWTKVKYTNCSMKNKKIKRWKAKWRKLMKTCRI